MAIIGAVLGDIAGSRIEFRRDPDFDWKTAPLFTDKCRFTDDTVMSIATKYAVQNETSFDKAYRMFGKKYPYAGYGSMFKRWIFDPTIGPYESYGNGSAMRVSFIADAFSGSTLLERAEQTAACTHNHPEGIKGAQVTAQTIEMAKTCGKEEMLEFYCRAYPAKNYRWHADISLDELRPIYKFDVTAHGTVPVAFRCFYESTDFESCIRNVFSLRGDVDTMGAIAGPMAETFYGGTGLDNASILNKYLDPFLYKALMAQ